MASIGVLGAGTWGIALARMLSNCGHDVIVWSAISEEIKELQMTHMHHNLSGVIIPADVLFTCDIAEACKTKDVILVAVPSGFVRATIMAASQYIEEGQIIVDASKGIEKDTLLTMTAVIIDELKGKRVSLVALSGPTHAEEIARDIPSTIVSACEDIRIAETVQDIFMNSCLRVYTNPDVLGVELCGAIKNVIALAVGISYGLGFGDNTSAAIITRGMAEITNLGKKMGCIEQTFNGLAGLGDLVVTSTSIHSRNRRCGVLIGQGVSPDDATKQVGMVVEGLNCLPAVVDLSKKYNVSMPIVSAVNDIVFEGLDPREAVYKLMNRSKKSEISSKIDFENTFLQDGRGVGMRRVITYGTYDLLHYGHINLLRRAKALGDYLIVVLSSDEFNWNEKRKRTYFTYEQRKQLLESVRYVDLVIPETSWEQKRTDMHEYHVNTFVMGDDWTGKFDFLKEEGVEVVYLPRTPEISSSQIKKDLYDANAVDGDSKLQHDDINTDPVKQSRL